MGVDFPSLSTTEKVLLYLLGTTQTFGSAENCAGNLKQKLFSTSVSISNIGFEDGGGVCDPVGVWITVVSDWGWSLVLNVIAFGSYFLVES